MHTAYFSLSIFLSLTGCGLDDSVSNFGEIVTILPLINTYSAYIGMSLGFFYFPCLNNRWNQYSECAIGRNDSLTLVHSFREHRFKHTNTPHCIAAHADIFVTKLHTRRYEYASHVPGEIDSFHLYSFYLQQTEFICIEHCIYYGSIIVPICERPTEIPFLNWNGRFNSLLGRASLSWDTIIYWHVIILSDLAGLPHCANENGTTDLFGRPRGRIYPGNCNSFIKQLRNVHSIFFLFVR